MPILLQSCLAGPSCSLCGAGDLPPAPGAGSVECAVAPHCAGGKGASPAAGQQAPARRLPQTAAGHPATGPRLPRHDRPTASGAGRPAAAPQRPLRPQPSSSGCSPASWRTGLFLASWPAWPPGAGEGCGERGRGEAGGVTDGAAHVLGYYTPSREGGTLGTLAHALGVSRGGRGPGRGRKAPPLLLTKDASAIEGPHSEGAPQPFWGSRAVPQCLLGSTGQLKGELVFFGCHYPTFGLSSSSEPAPPRGPLCTHWVLLSSLPHPIWDKGPSVLPGDPSVLFPALLQHPGHFVVPLTFIC